MSHDARTIRRPARVITLGDFDPLTLIAPIAGALITGGATVGSAFITSSAQESVAKGQQKTQLQIALDQDKNALAIAQLGVQQSGQVAQVASQTVSTGGIVLGAFLLLSLLLGGR